ncbi:unnamed protein product [Lactuca saligna]|uniref:Uncharacterized protein n=1 Tax=Lactuca saligna TaxID=75948 RepID=A0AA36ELB8_LACSI|nr:unnamed protein product [Lactuca saligna]
MRNRAIQSNLPFSTPTDDETNYEPVSSEISQTTATGEAHNTTIISDDSPPKSPHVEAFQPPSYKEHLTEFMFDDDNAYISALPIFSAFKSFQKPSSSNPVNNFDISTSSSEQEE